MKTNGASTEQTVKKIATTLLASSACRLA
jgi:hypothetical protein